MVRRPPLSTRLRSVSSSASSHSRSSGSSQVAWAGRSVIRHEHDEGEQDRRDRLEDEHPLPALQSKRAVHLENQAGENRCDRVRHRHGDVQDRDGAAAVRGRKPVGEIKDDAGKESGLGHAQQEAQHDEADRPGGRGHQAGDDAPGDHDASDPYARAGTMQDHVAGHFEQRIAEEEDARAQAEPVGRQAQVLVHGERSEGDVGAIDVGHQVAQHDQGQQAPGHLQHGASLKLGREFARACCVPP